MKASQPTIQNEQLKAEILNKMLRTKALVSERANTQIQFAVPILKHGNKPVFFSRTINVIQGKAGSHKSRLAEALCTALLKNNSEDTNGLGFHKASETPFAVCYVDTERNLTDQLPHVVQQIRKKAGFGPNEVADRFDYISLLEFDRNIRFEALNIYLEHVRAAYPGQLFVILDVVTDCVFNFNDSNDSMRLIDMLNMSINQYDVSFLCLIHENPGRGEKARGHLGTELINKASTVMQIGFIEDPQNTQEELIRIKYLKCRNSKKHEPIYVQYDEASHGLKMAGSELVNAVLEPKAVKAEIPKLTEAIGEVLLDEMSRRELIKILCEELDCSKRTVVARLKKVLKDGIVIPSAEGNKVLCSRIEKKMMVYYLKSGSP